MGTVVRFGKVIPEECCFECKDGGEDLRVCDKKNCLKSYHSYCTVRGDFPPPGEQFICNWHTCVDCRKSSDYQCLCCPNYSVCRNCLRNVEFFKVGKQNKGLCRSCIGLAITIEKNAADRRAKSNYQETDISLLLFKDYWDVIKDRERLTWVDLQEASGFRRDLGLYCTREADAEKFPDENHKSDEDLLGDSDGSKPDKMNTSVKRKRSKRKTYVGWGTKELIEFLSCFGKDTKEPLDEAEVVGVVKEYITQKGLFLGDKKKYFECDDKLRPLFTRRKVRYNMLHSKLRIHLASNAASEDESLDGSEADDGPIMKKKPQANLEPKIAKRVSERNKRCLASLNQHNINLIYLRKSVASDLLKHRDTFEQKVVGCFVRVKNNTGYNFSQKSKSPFQLGLVTGIKKSEEEYKIKDTYTDIILCVAGFWGDVKITMLSEEDIQEDEINDLIPLVEKGLLKRVTVVEFEEKVAAVHRDIVNHWINKELKRLEKEIDLANEKGWRKEMSELMDRKNMLSTPAERQRRLEVIPEIVADAEDEKETELKIAAGNSFQVNREAAQPVADSFNALKEKSSKAECASESFEVLKEKPPEEQAFNAFNILNEETSKGAVDQVADSLTVHEEESPEGATKKMAHSYSLSLNEESTEVASNKQGDGAHQVASEAGEALSSGVTPDSLLHPPVNKAQAGDALSNGVTPDSLLHPPVNKAQAGEVLYSGVTPDCLLHPPVNKAQDGSKTQAIDIDEDESNHTKRNKGSRIPVHEVINLDNSDDEEDVHGPESEMMHPPGAMNGGGLHREQPELSSRAALHSQGAMNRFRLRHGAACPCALNGISPQRPVWYYVDPQGDTRGPFPLIKLWEWKKEGYFDESFKVWRVGQTKDNAILLIDAFRMIL